MGTKASQKRKSKIVVLNNEGKLMRSVPHDSCDKEIVPQPDGTTWLMWVMHVGDMRKAALPLAEEEREVGLVIPDELPPIPDLIPETDAPTQGSVLPASPKSKQHKQSISYAHPHHASSPKDCSDDLLTHPLFS